MPITVASLFLNAILVMGSMALTRALQKKPRKPSSFYSWEAPTSSRDDVPYAWVFGRMRVQGNVFSQYRDVEYTSTEENHIFLKTSWFLNWGVPYNPTVPGTETWNVNRAVKGCRTRLFCRIGVGEGPIQGFVEGKARFDGKLLDDIPDLTTTTKTGTVDQTASSMGNRIEYPQEAVVTQAVPVTIRMPDKDYTRCGIILGFPNGFTIFGSDGDKIATFLGVKIEIRELGGAWHTLFNYYLFGKSAGPVFYEFYNDEQYSEGSPFVVTSGVQHEWRVSITNDYSSSKRVASMEVSSVHAIYDDDYTFPGLAYREVEALPTAILNTQLDYEDIVDGLICESIDGSVLEWTDNPARIAKFVFTRPVISGTGESGDPYTVDYYRGYDASKLHQAEFEALEDWCDELVSDGDGGTEKRFTFNAAITSQMECWELAQKIGAMCRANFWFDGQKIRCWIDKPATPSHIVCMGNITFDSYKESSTDIRTRPKYIESVLLNENTDFTEEPIRVVNVGSSSEHTIKLEGIGCTRSSQFVRLSKFIFDKSDNSDLVHQWDMDTAGLDLEPGQVVYLQHDTNGRAHGGRITAYGSNWVQIDKEPAVDDSSGAMNKLILQTVTATGKHVDVYDVDYVTYDYKVYLRTGLVHTPVVGDVYIFGDVSKIDKARITTSQVMPEVSTSFLAEQYKDAYYLRDSGDPDYDTLVFRSAIRGGPKTLKPVTREDLLNGLPEDRIFDGDVLESIKIADITFLGNSVDTVIWTCGSNDSGEVSDGLGWIRLRGVSYPIQSNAVGTQLHYIYFDPAAADPTTLKSTNDLADLRGLERYVLCLNVSGVAYPKPGLLIGADGNVIDADDVADGSRGLKEFHEYFQDPHGTMEVRWPNATPSGITMSIEPGGASGDNLLRIASDGSGGALVTYWKSVPFDPSYLYRVRARIRKNSGTPAVSIGLAGRNATDAAWVNAAGNDLQTGQHYAACFEHAPAASWEVVTGYIYGQNAAGTEESSSDPENPGKMHTNVRWFRPTIVVDFQSASGVVDIDELNVDVMPPTMGSIRPTVTDQGAVGDGVVDDTNALRVAIAAAILSKRPVILPKGTYRITDTIEIGDGLSVVTGLTIQAEGWESAKIIWDGDPDKNMVEILSCNGLVLDNIWIDGDNVSGVTGVYHSTGAAASSQFTTLRRCGVVNCPGVGYHIKQLEGIACDYFSFDNCVLGYNGINLKIEGGARQVEMYGGANINAATYGVEVVDGRFTVYDGLFALNGYDAVAKERTGCDIYMSGLISQIQVFGASSESLRFLDGNWAADAGSSRLLSANVIHNLNQAPRGDMPVGELEDPAAIDVTINYDCPRPLILTGCKVMGDIAVGSKCSSIQSIHTDFYNYERPSTSGDPITGFTGAGVSKVNIIGRTDNGPGTGEGSLTSTTILGGGRFLVVEDGWLKGIDLLDNGGTVYRRMGFSDGPPDTYYARQGWIVFAVNPTEAGALGWVCTVAGTPTTVKATFKAFGTNLIGATVTDYARNSVLTAVDAAALQAALSLGTMAAQNANNVNISGGVVTGITDLAVADGGTGASTAAAAATNLGLGTGNSPQFTAVNIGHASDTTITRVSAGNIAVEGNALYRAGGTDVPVADGGTGASTAAAARTNLGVGTSDSPQFAAVNIGDAADTTITRVSAGNIAVEGNAIYRAGGTDIPIADGGTGASTAAAAATNLGLGTTDNPQFNSVNIGHATDTTITRVSAGNIAVEGNALYRAGGTDVPVTDGGTGASTAADARSNLGVKAIATLADTPTAITSNTNASSSDSGKHYTNMGATGTIYLMLPAATPGLIFAVTRIENQAFWVKPYTDEYHRAQVANKFLELTSNGMTVVFKCLYTGVWEIIAAGVGSTAWMGP